MGVKVKLRFCYPDETHCWTLINSQVGKPKDKALPINRRGNLIIASSDENLKDIFHQIRTSKTPAVINYDASWCSPFLLSFCQLRNKFPELSFIYAHIDECPETTKHIRFKPTFRFYRGGERVDEMFGAGEERLHDRLWLHS